MSIAEVRAGTNQLPPIHARPMSGPEAGHGIDEIHIQGRTLVNAAAAYEAPPSEFGYTQLEKGPAGQIEATGDHTKLPDVLPQTIDLHDALAALTYIPQTNQGRSAMHPTSPPPGHLNETGSHTPIHEPRRVAINVILALAAQAKPPATNMGLSVHIDPIQFSPIKTAAGK
jgi:hypothetical protein